MFHSMPGLILVYTRVGAHNNKPPDLWIKRFSDRSGIGGSVLYWPGCFCFGMWQGEGSCGWQFEGSQRVECSSLFSKRLSLWTNEDVSCKLPDLLLVNEFVFSECSSGKNRLNSGFVVLLGLTLAAQSSGSYHDESIYNLALQPWKNPTQLTKNQNAQSI